WGHVHPMVPLARAFVEQGDEVAWAVTAGIAPRLEGEGFAVHAAGQSLDLSFREALQRFPEIHQLPPTERPNKFFPQFFGAVQAPAMLSDLLPVARAFDPALLVCDQAELAGPIAAAVLGVPNVTHSFGGLLPAHRLETTGRVVAPLWEAHGLAPRPYCGTYDHLYLDIYPPSMQTEDGSHVPFRQLLRPETFVTGEDEALPDVVTGDSPAPLVYVTFGTVFNANPELVSTVVAAVRDLPVRVVLTVGPTADPGELGAQPANVHVARYIPQTQLLPYCSAVVSHAGSGTLLAALARGLPQLCLPQAADQFGNAAACAAAGAGRALLPGFVTVESVRAEMTDILADPAYRGAAERVAAEIRAMPSPAEVAGVIAARFG
ncbi:MAG TPA: glycosyltransferase, partial [Acidimicrobiales bacterium]